LQVALTSFASSPKSKYKLSIPLILIFLLLAAADLVVLEIVQELVELVIFVVAVLPLGLRLALLAFLLREFVVFMLRAPLLFLILYLQ
jgi:glucose-6-phosphate-specific signal transduction histidine kinase